MERYIVDKDKNKNKEPILNFQYTNDFIKRIRTLQAHFTGKNRRTLFEKLQEEGILTKEYTI
jgi:hypothetical protein